MPDRLDAADAALLHTERVATPMHVGSVMIFEPSADGIDHDRLTDLVAARIGGETRYRQRVREMPGPLGGPLWVDDVGFDIAYHVRRAALPRPGDRAQLSEFVARVMGRPLDRARPLWEVYLVEGLAGGEFALVTKVHQALVDGITAVDIGQLILDETPDVLDEPDEPPLPPRREPTDLELVVGALWEELTRPRRSPRAVLGQALDLVRSGRGALGTVLAEAGGLFLSATDQAPRSPLDVNVGAARRVHMSALALEDFRRVRDAAQERMPGLDVSVHDVVLAAVTGGLRTWLSHRGEPVYSATTVRALVPLGASDRAPEGDDAGRPEPLGGRVDLVDRVVGEVVDLPVGEPGVLARLERISFQTRRPGGVGAGVMARAAGFAPSTLHHLGARLGQLPSPRRFNLVVTNVPGPQRPRFLPGARLLATYPILPLGAHHALAVGLTSYDGLVCLGLSADRAALGDVDLLGDAIAADLAEMLAQLGLDETDDDAGGAPPSFDLGYPAADVTRGRAAPVRDADPLRRGPAPNPPAAHPHGREDAPMTTTRRVYLRVSPDDLARLSEAAQFDPADGTAFAVTSAVRAAFPDDDEEDLEYAALWVAATEDTGRRRLVLAADLPTARVGAADPAAAAALSADAQDDDGGAAYLVSVTGPVRRGEIVAVHVGEAGAAPDDELDWYDASEIHVLVAAAP